MTTHLLIGCGGLKLDHAAPARELYTGPLFRAARGYAESSGLPWAVLSARYGVVLPEQVIAPYEYRLGAFDYWPNSEYFTWYELGLKLRAWMGGGSVLEVHAGKVYGDWALRAIHTAPSRPVEVLFPLAGLQVGERLSWYRQRRAA